MSLTKWSDRNLIPSFNNWIDSYFGDSEFFRGFFTEKTVPACNIAESETAYSLELAIPGKSKDDFNVEVSNGHLFISSEEETTKESEEKNFTRKEYSYSSFKRSFSLPENVDSANVEAKYADGILVLTLPKTEPSKPETKLITVG